MVAKVPVGRINPAAWAGADLSTLGSSVQGVAWITAGRVTVDGRVIRDSEFPVVRGVQRIAIDGVESGQGEARYLMLNKPRGLVTTARDERDRDTVYRCFDGAGLGWIAPVGRLDKASEGLLLFASDPEWAARITDPETAVKDLSRAGGRIPTTLWLVGRGLNVDGELLRDSVASCGAAPNAC